MKYVSLICSECGKEFDRAIKLSKRIGNKKYCSKQCCTIGIARTRHNKTIESNKVKINCAFCSILFSPKSNSKYKKAISKNQKDFYCSRKCSISIHNPPKEYTVLICKGCGNNFNRAISQHRYNMKRWEHIYCSKECGGKYSLKHQIDLTISPFRLFIHKAKGNGSRLRNLDFDITPEYLKQIWENQNGICPISGWHLRLPQSSQKWERGYAYSIDNASLDRIDNSKGYIQGNVRFVALMTNFARNKFTDEEVIEFANAVVEYQSTLRKAA